VEACVLCLRTDRPLTREHVFAHWLVRKVQGGRLFPSDESAGASPASSRPTTIARVTAEVCATCNAGWMSTLEVSFRQAVFARPRVGLVWPPDRITLSRWFAKTAVLLAHARGAAFLSATHRSQIVTGMPDDIEVFVARRRRPRQRLDFALDLLADRDGETQRARAVAILVDDFVGHVAARGTLTSKHGTRLWPLRTHALRWETLPVITPLLVKDL
jgi:hypothetical protein